jgi:UDP-N-acetyl-2-amino-2-deoxyglucuronate dehydrogenase
VALRLGLIGCGFVAGLHSRALKGLARAGVVDAEVVATCDLDRGRAESFARAHRADLATQDPGQVLGAVDAVWVSTPTASHRRLVEAAVGAGVAVFCEKPLATDLADAEAMGAAVTAARVPAQVGLVLRSSPPYRRVVEVVRSGALGRPLAVVFRDDQYFPTQGQYGSTWRADVAQAGGGTLLEHSIHDLDVLGWLLGDLVWAGARTANFAGCPGIEDVAVATLGYAGGATASLVSVWHQILSRPSGRYLEVICEHGMAVAPSEYTGPVRLLTDRANEDLPCPAAPWHADLPVDERWRPAVAPYATQARAFLDAVAEGQEPEPGFGVAVTAHRAADALYRSAAGEGVAVPLGS